MLAKIMVSKLMNRGRKRKGITKNRQRCPARAGNVRTPAASDRNDSAAKTRSLKASTSGFLRNAAEKRQEAFYSAFP